MSRGHCRCLQKKGGALEPRQQDGTQATEPERGTQACGHIPWDSQRARGWDPPQDLLGDSCSVSFLSEDISEDMAGPLSSTRRSLLEELEPGGGCGLGEPPPSVTSRTPWPHLDPRSSPGPPQPLASSTLLTAGDALPEGPPNPSGGRRRRGPPWGLPQHSPQQPSGPGGSLRPPQSRCCRRVPGGHEAAPQAPLLRGGGWGARDGAPHGWAGLGVPELAAPTLGSGDPSSFGDPSSSSERFFSALETLEPSQAEGCRGAQHPHSPQPRAAVGLGEAPSPPGAAAPALCPPRPPSAGRPQREGLRGGSRAAPCGEASSEVGGVGGLLVQLEGCSLRGTPPHTPEPPPSPALEGLEPPSYRHVTPRTKRRLQASAGRLGAASSSSSLFEETLEVPRRPPRVRAPRGVPRDPPTATGLWGGAEVSSGDGDRTGSLDDTKILPGAPSPTVLLNPGDHGHPQDTPGSSATVLVNPGDRGHPQDTPGSSATVLLNPGDRGHPQDTPGSSATVLLNPGDRGHPQDTPGSSATVLLNPGDRGHSQDNPTNAQGSNPTVLLNPGDHGHPQDTPGSSSTVPLVRRDHGHPQDTPTDAQSTPGFSPPIMLLPGDRGDHHNSSDAQGSPGDTSSPRPGLLEVPSPLGTCFGHLLALRPPHSPVLEPGDLATLPSPSGHCTHCAGEQLQDEEQGPVTTEWHSPGTEATTSPKDTVLEDRRAHPVLPQSLSDESLRRRLQVLGDDPGPITDLTRRLYLRRLEKLVRRHQGMTGGHSPELAAALRSGHIPDCAHDELVLTQQFDHPDRNRHWREGLVKSSFNYLLLDPRTTQNLPLRCQRLSSAECFRTFVEAIFYVGKGSRARPNCHLAEALSLHSAGKQKGGPKVQRILEIWASGQGVISLHCFHNTVPAEAYTREGCLLEALGLQALTNRRKGQCYGAVGSWPAERRRRLGVHLLHRAMRIFLAEGERQLRPLDIQGGR